MTQITQGEINRCAKLIRNAHESGLIQFTNFSEPKVSCQDTLDQAINEIDI